MLIGGDSVGGGISSADYRRNASDLLQDFERLDPDQLAGPGTAVVATQRTAHHQAIVRARFDQLAADADHLPDPHRVQRLGHRIVRRNQVHVGGTGDDLALRNREFPQLPVEEAPALADLDLVQHRRVRHPPPAERQIGRHQAGDRIEAVVLAAQHPGFERDRGQRLQGPGLVGEAGIVAIERRLKDDDLVVLPPLGYSPTGEVFNLAMGDVAAATAVALKADKLIFLMESAGVAGSRGELLRELTVREAQGLLSKGRVQSEEMQSYLPAAVRACEQGVGRAHLISGHLDDSLLLELFTHKGVGTLLTPDPIETLRHAKIDDIGGILGLLEPLEADGILVKRSRDLLEMEIDRFWVLEHDRMIIGCAALYPFSDERAGELAGLAVHPDFRGRGAGERLMEAIEKRAKGLRLKQLFVLTTRAEHWFVERGFVETGVSALPQKKKELYNYHRRSVVLTKRL